MKVLVVEDHRGQLAALAAILEAEHCDPVPTRSGAEALDQFGTGQTFDAAIIDFLLPDMGGLELARELRRRRVDLSIAGMSGFGLLLDEAIRTDKVFDVFWSKPIQLDWIQAWRRSWRKEA